MPVTSRIPLVLVAEDEDSVRGMLGVVLRAAGFDSLLCVDGRDALDRLEAGLSPDVVLLDIRMPRLGGVELARAIRREARWDAIPIVAMSAYSDQLQQQQIIEAGADAFLPKPFTISDLREVLTGLAPRVAPRAGVEPRAQASPQPPHQSQLPPAVGPELPRRLASRVGSGASQPIDPSGQAAHAHRRELHSQGELMRAFRAAPLFELASLLGGMRGAPATPSLTATEQAPSWRVERLRRIVPICLPLCEEYGLAASAVTLGRLATVLASSEPPAEAELSSLVEEALGRLTDELSLQSILFLDHVDAGLYQGRVGIDRDVLRAFPSVQDDLAEAAKCLALGRGTATVFHCMRVLQAMLRAVAWDLGDPLIDAREDDGWAQIVERFERQLRLGAAERSPEWQRRGPLYVDVTERLQVLGASWRSATLRPASLYTEEQARAIWSQTQELLRLLSAEVAEPGGSPPA